MKEDKPCTDCPEDSPVPSLVDVLIPLGPDCGWGHYQELRYSLRSVEKYVKNLGNVWIIGRKPDWITGVIHIDARDPYRQNKDANLIQKVVLGCIYGVSSPFIRMSDDQIFLGPYHGQTYHVGEISSSTAFGYPKWDKRIQATYKLLKKTKKSYFNYDGHVPLQCHPEVVIKTALNTDYGSGNGYCINTLLLNHHEIERTKMPLDYKVACTTPTCFSSKKDRIAKASVLNFNDKGLSRQLKNYLQERFPAPCSYEIA